MHIHMYATSLKHGCGSGSNSPAPFNSIGSCSDTDPAYVNPAPANYVNDFGIDRVNGSGLCTC